MQPMISLALAAAAFALIHLGVSGTRLRDALVGRIGQGAYMVAFSLGSVATLVWLISAYRAAPYVATWGQLQWWKPVAIALMLPAFLLVVIGLTTPNPTAVAQEGMAARAPVGIVRVTRHPFLTGVALWAGVHLVGNGDWASLLFFASLAVVSVAGTLSIDAKRRRALGAAVWDGFARGTSIVPFAAILGGPRAFVMAGDRLVATRGGRGRLRADAGRACASDRGLAVPGVKPVDAAQGKVTRPSDGGWPYLMRQARPTACRS